MRAGIRARQKDFGRPALAIYAPMSSTATLVSSALFIQAVKSEDAFSAGTTAIQIFQIETLVNLAKAPPKEKFHLF